MDEAVFPLSRGVCGFEGGFFPPPEGFFAIYVSFAL